MTIKREENKIKPVNILDTEGAHDSPRVDFYDRPGPKFSDNDKEVYTQNYDTQSNNSNSFDEFRTDSLVPSDIELQATQAAQ